MSVYRLPYDISVNILAALLFAVGAYLFQHVGTRTLGVGFGVSGIILSFAWLLYERCRLGIRRVWYRPFGKLRYRLADATFSYDAMGVTLASMLEVTGLGVDLPTLARSAPRGLRIRFLLLHPDSPHFIDRIAAARPNGHTARDLAKKRQDIQRTIDAVHTHLTSMAEIRLFDAPIPFFLQIVDKSRVYLATQTRGGVIGQLYPLGISLVRGDLAWTAKALFESTWKHATPVNPDGSIPPLFTSSMTEAIPHIATALLFDRNGKLLVYLRDDKPTIPFPNHWDLFGGYIEEGETPEQALVREVQEELGITLLDYQFFRRYDCASGDIRPNVKYVFWARLPVEASSLTLHEGQRLAAVPLEEAQDIKFANILGRIVADFSERRRSGTV